MEQTSAPMACSICDASTVLPEKRLYGYNVCTKCHSDFAMKRAFAYIVDMTLWSIFCFPLTFFIFVLSGISGAVVGAATHNDNSGANLFVFVLFVCCLGHTFLLLGMDCFPVHSPPKAIFGLQAIDVRTGHHPNFFHSFPSTLLLP